MEVGVGDGEVDVLGLVGILVGTAVGCHAAVLADERLDILVEGGEAPSQDDPVGVEAREGGRRGCGEVRARGEEHWPAERGGERDAGQRVREGSPRREHHGPGRRGLEGRGHRRGGGVPVRAGEAGDRAVSEPGQLLLDALRDGGGPAEHDDRARREPPELVGGDRRHRVGLDEQHRPVGGRGGRAAGQRVGEAGPGGHVDDGAGLGRRGGDGGGGGVPVRAGEARDGTRGQGGERVEHRGRDRRRSAEHDDPARL